MLDETKNNSGSETSTNPQTPHSVNAPCDCFECFLETECEEVN